MWLFFIQFVKLFLNYLIFNLCERLRMFFQDLTARMEIELSKNGILKQNYTT
jgi:hypothetical protein